MLPDEVACWMRDAVGRGSRVVSFRRLRCGSWHVNHAVDVVDAVGGVHRLVLRCWARPGWQEDDPDYTVEREVRVLELLRSAPVPVPEVVAADPAGARCGVPALLITRLRGHPPSPADAGTYGFCRQLADALATIHDVDGAAAVPAYRLYYDRPRAVLARWMPATANWAQAIAAIRESPPPATTTTLIHRDYHPDNTLWSHHRLTGVVDWTQASHGPPELDVGHLRWNLVADHGQDVADQFLACYRTTTGRTLHDQPYWDLVSLFDLLLDSDEPGDITPDDLQRFERYAETALTRWT